MSLAVQNVLANVAGGLVLLVTKPFTVGDYIDTPSGEGTVREMSLTYTFLETMEGQRLAVPNSTLSSGKIINYSTLATRRLQHKITASYDDATADVRRACLTAVGRTANVLTDPAPVVYVSSYGESSIEYIVRCWTKTEDYWPAYYQLLEEIRNAFNEAGVEMCYNHLNVHIIEKKEETE